MKKRHLILALLCCASACVFGQKTYELSSPDGHIRLAVNLSDAISYDIICGTDTLLRQCTLQMELGEQVLGEKPRITKASHKNDVNETLTPVVPLKYSVIHSRYNQLLLQFKGDYAIEFRAFDNGVAHRFVTNLKDSIDVTDETFRFTLPDNSLLHMQQPGGFKTAYEEEYTHMDCRDWQPASRMALLPLLIDTRRGYKLLLSESALSDYPAMFLKSEGRHTVSSVFPKVPLAFGKDGDRSLKILKEAYYIARTAGKRNFPWRYFVIANDDRQLLENTLTCQLAEPCRLGDTSWIKPGLASWEWWNGATPYGEDVDFKAGCNLDTYKYFIDFASKFGIPYIVMDEGWAKSTRDPFTPNPDVDLHELIRYGKEKNVGIVLWLTWLTVENHPELFATFEKWGIRGLKIDFMDRSDQWMVNFYERVAREAAKHHLFVDFHGSFKPAGLEYMYPNVLSYEGVRGMEQMGGCRPDNSVYLPFMRNAVGPMDYTPGAMLSMQPEVYSSNRPNSASIGTRAYQMALFVLFESGLQMLADNPTLYYRNEDCTRFIASVPQTWDETRALHAKVGEYAIVAKHKGGTWYIGGITNNQKEERFFELDLSFLAEGTSYRLTFFEDGPNANRQAMDYKKKEYHGVKKGDRVAVWMARNGGFAAVLQPTNR